MRLRTIAFKGFFEEQAGETGEELQIVVPESQTETDLLSWAILAHPETIQDDSARTDYVFHYDLDRHLGDGLFALKVSCRDASGVLYDVEIAAALVATVGAIEQSRSGNFTPLWFISKRLHYKPLDDEMEEHYHRPAFGHLRFGGVGNLPHRRLFGTRV